MLELFDKKKTIPVRTVNDRRNLRRDKSNSSESDNDFDEPYEQKFVSEEMRRYHDPVEEPQQCHDVISF